LIRCLGTHAHVEAQSTPGLRSLAYDDDVEVALLSVSTYESESMAIWGLTKANLPTSKAEIGHSERKEQSFPDSSELSALPIALRKVSPSAQ
jgi:hypothetical protein